MDGAPSEIKIAPWGPRMGAEEVVLDMKDPKWKFILLCADFSSEKPRSFWGHFSLMHAFVYLTQRPLEVDFYNVCWRFTALFPSKLKWRGTQIILKKSLYQAGTDSDKCPMCINAIFFPFQWHSAFFLSTMLYLSLFLRNARVSFIYAVSDLRCKCLSGTSEFQRLVEN